MLRFLLLAFPVLLLGFGAHVWLSELFGWVLPGRGELSPGHLQRGAELAAWVLQATVLIVLFLLLDREGRNRAWTGLLAGAMLWLVRAPTLVLVIQAAGWSSGAWWAEGQRLLPLFAFLGLLLASIARAVEMPRP